MKHDYSDERIAVLTTYLGRYISRVPHHDHSRAADGKTDLNPIEPYLSVDAQSTSAGRMFRENVIGLMLWAPILRISQASLLLKYQ